MKNKAEPKNIFKFADENQNESNLAIKSQNRQYSKYTKDSPVKEYPLCHTPRARQISPVIKLASLVLAGAYAVSLSPIHAAEQICDGTLLKTRINERITSSINRFRFSLNLEAEHSNKDTALGILNRRLEEARKTIQPLALGDLTISAPRIYAYGGGTTTPGMERASTFITGEVGLKNYDAIIQAAGLLPGIRLNGITSIAANDKSNSIEDQLLTNAIATGQRKAQTTAQALGLRKAELLMIDQRGTSYRPIGSLRNAIFKPEEAPKPSRSLAVNLDYCLH